MSTTRDCKHGRLARSCEICELEGKVEVLGVGLSIARKIIDRIHAECEKYGGITPTTSRWEEIKRLAREGANDKVDAPSGARSAE